MAQDPGNNHHSGTEETPKRKKRKKKKKKPKLHTKGNGKDSGEELLEPLAEENKKLTAELEASRQRYQDLRKRFVRVEKAGMDERAVVKLRCLNHMFGRLINFQATCKEDKARIERLVQDAMHVMKDQVEKASKPV